MPNDAGSVTQWINSIRNGSDEAPAAIWSRYFDRLHRVAKARLGRAPKRVFDEEDVAISVLDTLCRGLTDGRFPELKDRHSLWCLLMAITNQKVIDFRRKEGRIKRGGGQVRGDSAFALDKNNIGTIDALPGVLPTPEELAIVSEEFERLLGLLRDDHLRIIAVAKMEGYGNDEIAKEMGVSVRTIQRKLTLVHDKWSRVFESSWDKSQELR